MKEYTKQEITNRIARMENGVDLLECDIVYIDNIPTVEYAVLFNLTELFGIQAPWIDDCDENSSRVEFTNHVDWDIFCNEADIKFPYYDCPHQVDMIQADKLFRKRNKTFKKVQQNLISQFYHWIKEYESKKVILIESTLCDTQFVPIVVNNDSEGEERYETIKQTLEGTDTYVSYHDYLEQ